MKFNNESCLLSMDDTEWHGVLAHAPFQRIDKTQTCVTGMKVIKTDNRNCTCTICVKAKMKRRTFNHDLLKETTPGAILHSDIGNLPTPSLGKSNYIVVFVCEASRYIRCYFMNKADASTLCSRINQCLANQNADIGRLPVKLHSDKGRNYMSDEVVQFLYDKHITPSYSTAHNHEENGLSEKTLQDIMNMARSMLYDSDAPNSMWAEAANNAVYIMNRIYKASLDKTPYEAYFGIKPDISHLKKFGSPVMVQIPKQLRLNKLDYRAKEMRLVGHTDSSVIYRVANREYTSVTTETNIHFIKQNESSNQHYVSTLDDIISHQDSSTEEIDLDETAPIQPQTVEFLINTNEVNEPKSIKEMLEDKYSEYWLRACDEEFMALMYYDTWELVERSTETESKLLRGQWLFTKKVDANGMVYRFKARYVIDGSPISDSPFSPVINTSIMRLLLSYALSNQWHVHVIDIKNAFLNSVLDKEYYIEQVKMYEDPSKPNHVCKLKKSSYGLPESSYNWHRTISDYLVSKDYKQSRIEPCLFFKDKEKFFILMHIDDMQLMSEDLELINECKSTINEKFKLTDKGEIKDCLGIEFIYLRERSKMYVNQQQKIIQLYEENKLNLPNATKLPIPQDFDLFKQSEPYEDKQHYQSIVGSLNYIAVCTKPHLQIYVNQLSRFLKSPTKHHLYAAYKLISYLYEYRKDYLKYECSDQSSNVHAYVDASQFNTESNRGRCTSGAVIQLFGNSVHWVTRKQSIIVGDVCEAELYAINLGLRITIYFRNVLAELRILTDDQDKKMMIYSDNQSSINIATEGLKKNSKHYNTNLLMIKDYVERNEVVLKQVQGRINIADVMTKFVDHNTFYDLKKKIGVVHLIMKTKKSPTKN